MENIKNINFFPICQFSSGDMVIYYIYNEIRSSKKKKIIYLTVLTNKYGIRLRRITFNNL